MENVKIIYRHGEDDFSLWEVDLPANIIAPIKRGYRKSADNVSTLLQQMPITDMLPDDTIFIFVWNKNELALYSGRAGADFAEKYAHDGCSTRADLAYIVEMLCDSHTAEENIKSSVYKEFASKCCQKGLNEMFKTHNRTTYFRMRKMLEDNKIRFLGFGNDWNGEYEIRFSVHEG